MSAVPISLLGVIAGFTILLGLPTGRLSRPVLPLKAGLNGLAIGVLVFLVWVITGGVVLGFGLALGIVWSRALRPRSGEPPLTGALGRVSDPVAAGGHGSPTRPPRSTPAQAPSAGADLSLMIAVGIRLNNLPEGLAIGNSAASGELSLAVLLVVGFALHNAAEGFGIVAPLVSAVERPSWVGSHSSG